MTDLDDAMARAVDIGENQVSLIIFSALAFILSFISTFSVFGSDCFMLKYFIGRR